MGGDDNDSKSGSVPEQIVAVSTLSQTLGVAATQLKLMWRERRLLWLSLAVLLLAATSVATSSARLLAHAEERRAVAEAEAQLWNSQGVIDPHDAAHVGRSIPAPVRPLAAFDPGLSDFVGSSVFIEGHAQNPAQHRPVEGGTALSRFVGFSSAWTLQVVAPLLIILAGFATMSGEVARARLRQELGAGAGAVSLVGGRLLALAAAAGLLALVMCGVSFPAILLQGAGKNEAAALVVIGIAYALYLLIFSALTVAVSGLFASARTGLVILLGVWAISTLLVPRIAPSVAEMLKPTPSVPEFRTAVTHEAENGPNGHDPADERLNAMKDDLLARYQVSKVEDLPVNFRGVALQFGEQNSTETYNRHFEQLYKVYREQEEMQRAFSFLSPMIALQPLSRAYARTDFGSHLAYLRGVEDYRYRLIQALNLNVATHKPAHGQRYHLADIESITRDITYSPGTHRLADVAKAQVPNALILLVWLVLSIGLAVVSALRLGRQS
jgi:ABC-2 type transport system permease protein